MLIAKAVREEIIGEVVEELVEVVDMAVGGRGKERGG